MQQAARFSQYTGFFLSGRLIEYGPTVEIFERPKKKETEDYISGRFGESIQEGVRVKRTC